MDYPDFLTNDSNCTDSASSAFPPDVFTLDQRRHGLVVLHVIAVIYSFGSLSIVCDYYFMSSIEAICRKLDITGDVAGATFMSIGTSAPELITTCIGVFITGTNVGLGTVAGSTVFNMFFITAVVILTANTVISAEYWSVLRDLGLFVLVNIALFWACWDGQIEWYEAVVVLSLYIVYIIIMIFNQKIQTRLNNIFKREETKPLVGHQAPPTNEATPNGDSYQSLGGSRTSSVLSLHEALQEEFGSTYKSQLTWPDTIMDRLAFIVFLPIKILLWLTIPDCNKEGCWSQLYLLTFLTSGVWIGLTCYFMVWMIEIIGWTLGIPESFMAITFLAVGTSIPDCLASVVAGKKGHHTMAISNILGSNIFDLACTSLPWLIKIASTGSMTNVVKIHDSATIFTISSLLTSVVVFIIIFLLYRFKLQRSTALFFLAIYSVYLCITILFEFNVFGPVNLPYCDP